EVAVGRVGLEELRHLLHQPLENDIELELARHDLRRVQERRLLLQAPLVFGEQPRRLQRLLELALDGVDEELLAGRQRPLPPRTYFPVRDLDALELQRAAELGS